jgi:hypothetical protein
MTKALKGRNTLTMGEAHRNETITYSSGSDSYRNEAREGDKKSNIFVKVIPIFLLIQPA